jgi:molecular chaperone DnaK (HSP70)
MARAVGIDLGTTNSVIGARRDARRLERIEYARGLGALEPRGILE